MSSLTLISKIMPRSIPRLGPEGDGAMVVVVFGRVVEHLAATLARPAGRKRSGHH